MHIYKFFLKTLLFMFSPKKIAIYRYSLLLLENQILKRSLRQNDIKPHFNNFDRSVYLITLKINPRLKRFVTLVKPETVLYLWNKRLNNYWTHKTIIQKKGRPPVSQKIRKLVLEIKRDNYSWGYDRIVGALKALNIIISRDSVRRIIQTGRKNGNIKPNDTWKRFLKIHWDSLFACDFFTIDTFGFKRFYIFFILELRTRKIMQFGITTKPSMEFVRNQLNGFMFDREDRETYLIHDNSGELKWFDYESVGIKGLATVPYSPNMNAYAERFVGSIRREFLDHFIIFSRNQLQNLIKEYVYYYNNLRPHQGIANTIPNGSIPLNTGVIANRPVLFGLYKHYYLKAA